MIVLHQLIKRIFRGVDNFRVLQLKVRPEELDAKAKNILVLAVVSSDDLDYLRGNICVPDSMFDVFGEGAMALDDLVVVEQHLTPQVLLVIGDAVIIEVLLPSGQLLAHQPPAQLLKAPQALRKHPALISFK